MGLFLFLIGVQKPKEQVAAGLSALLSSGSFEAFRFHCHEGRRGITTVHFGNDGFIGHSRIAESLSASLNSPCILLDIYDGDFWMYELYSEGKVADRHNPIPDYWKKLPREEKSSWLGNPAKFAELWPGADCDSISKYMVFHENVNVDAKAFPEDKREYCDPWQMLDFMRRLGLEYSTGPETDAICRKINYAEGEEVPACDRWDENGIQPLVFASGAELGELLAKGADPNKRTRDGETPLFRSVHIPDPESLQEELQDAKALLDNGADPNLTDKYGRSPLAICVFYDNSKMAGLLLDNGADPNLPDNDGQTPLMFALEDLKLLFAIFLLRKGANPFVGKGVLDEKSLSSHGLMKRLAVLSAAHMAILAWKLKSHWKLSSKAPAASGESS